MRSAEERNRLVAQAKERLSVGANFVPPPYSDTAEERLFAIWQALAASQNYPDGVDEYIADDREPILREFFPTAHRLLFLGCGGGAEVKVARDLGYDACGITLNKNNVRHAREVFGLETVFYGDAHLMFEDWADTFDGVLGFQFLEHSPAPIIMLLEVKRVLRAGGRCYFETPGPKGWTLDQNLHHITCPTPEQARGWLLKAGFGYINQRVFWTDEAGRYLGFWGTK